MHRLSLRARIFLLLLFFGVSLFVVYLYTNPLYTVTRVTVTVDGGPQTVPQQVHALLSSQVGVQILRLKRSALLEELLAIGPVQQAEITRDFPNTLVAHIALVESPVVVASGEGYYLIKDEALVPISETDAQSYQELIATVEVPPTYAQMMVRWGVDQLFTQVIDLAASLGDASSLITRIKYDNNSSNSFGKMVLELSSLNAQIWVREPVGAARVEAAVALVQQDQMDSLYFLSSETQRYDLYREGLVRR